jgi:hypothetical protein
LNASVKALSGGICAWRLRLDRAAVLDIERIDLAVPNLPGEWEGATVAFISDFQQMGYL